MIAPALFYNLTQCLTEQIKEVTNIPVQELRIRKMPDTMDIDFPPIPSWVLVTANPQTSDTDLIPALVPIKLNSVLQWGQMLMTQLQQTAAEIRNLRSQIQGDKTEAYHIFRCMQSDYHKIKSNLNNTIAMAQQHATDNTGAHFNLTSA
jgi:hypothetical protein